MDIPAVWRRYVVGATAVLALASLAVWLHLRPDPCGPTKKYPPVLPSHCCDAPQPTGTNLWHPEVKAYLKRTGKTKLGDVNGHEYPTGNWICVFRPAVGSETHGADWEPEIENRHFF